MSNPEQVEVDQLPKKLRIDLNDWRWRARVSSPDSKASEFFDTLKRRCLVPGAHPFQKSNGKHQPTPTTVRLDHYLQESLVVGGDYRQGNRYARVKDLPLLLRSVEQIISQEPYDDSPIAPYRPYPSADDLTRAARQETTSYYDEVRKLLIETVSGDIYRVEHPNESIGNLSADPRQRVAQYFSDVFDVRHIITEIDFDNIKPFEPPRQ